MSMVSILHYTKLTNLIYYDIFFLVSTAYHYSCHCLIYYDLCFTEVRQGGVYIITLSPSAILYLALSAVTYVNI